MRMNLKLRLKDKEKHIINASEDGVITVALLMMEVLLLIFFSDKSWLSYFYFFSIVYFIVMVFYVIKIKIFTGIGLQCTYMIFFVQSGVLMQKLYYGLNEDAVFILMAYNILAPFVLMLSHPISKKKHNKELRRIDFKQSYVFIMFCVAVLSMLVFYFSAGFIPLFASDGENARVAAMAGRGKYVVVAANLFSFSILLTEGRMRRFYRLIIACVLLIGTGYRSSMLELLLLYFIVYGIGDKKKYFVKTGVTVIGLCFCYAIFGVIRSGIEWNVYSLYKPVLWRFFVNTSNLSAIIEHFPVNQLTYGSSIIQDISVILPGAQETFMTSLKTIMNYQFAGGSLTPTIFGEGYYSWYFIGAILWPLIVLAFVCKVDRYCQKRVDGRVYYIFAYSLLGFTTSSVVPVLLNTFLPTLFIYIIFKIIGKKQIVARCA